MDEPDEYLEKLLELKEDRCRRLQALISLKEARLAQLRGSPAPSPLAEEAVQKEPSEEGFAGAPAPAPLLSKNSSIVLVSETARNSAPLGKLQPGGRRDYVPMTLLSTVAAGPTRGCRTALQRSGLPRDVVRLWHGGQISADLAMRGLLDAVCRCSPSSAAAEERELYTMTQLYTANGGASLGGTLGSLVGGLPSERAEASTSGGKAVGKEDDLCPLRHVLGLPVDRVTNEALDLFARQLLTGAEAEPHACLSRSEERRALCSDLGKLSTEELNLAFRRACLKQVATIVGSGSSR